MKTEAELKSLTEFAAEFLGMRLENGFWKLPNEKVGYPKTQLIKLLFMWSRQSPCLAHLAEQEANKQGYDFDCWTLGNGKIYGCRIQPPDRDKMHYAFHEDENKYIAFWQSLKLAKEGYEKRLALWSAIESTGEKGG